jgi:predicted RNase H-like nuclease (RuvC/YqgF family)
MPENDALIEQLTRGFSGLRDELRRREETEAKMSERVGLIEYRLGEQSRTLEAIQSDMAKAETVRLKMRVDGLEAANVKAESKQMEISRRIWGLVAGMIMLIVGWLFNFVRIGLK